MWDNIVLSGFADEIDPSLDEQIRVLKKLGMNHIEMRGVLYCWKIGIHRVLL